jgi:hypothetical protein
MKAVRIYAVGIEDERHKLVLIGQIDNDGYLNKEVESFGSMTDVDLSTDQWTQSIFRLSESNGDGIMFYGDNTYDPSSTNLYKKHLAPGESFSIKYEHEDEDTNEVLMVIRTINDYVHD